MTEPTPIQRWTAKRRRELVLSIIKGDTSAQEAARSHDLTVGEIERWVERAMGGMENSLRSKPRDEEAQAAAHVAALERKVGRQALELDIMKEAIRPYRPFPEGTQSE